jgi:small subunit ribosomal protein S17
MSKALRRAPLETIPKLIRGEVTRINPIQKMIKVLVARRVVHPVYGKILSRHTTFNVHWEGEQRIVVGDIVEIMESRPISKSKHHIFVRKATR